MIRLHHLNQSRSLRTLWLLEELGQPYEIISHQRDANTHYALQLTSIDSYQRAMRLEANYDDSIKR